MSDDLVDRRRLAPAFLVGRVPAEPRVRRSIVRCWAFVLGGWAAALVAGPVAQAVLGSLAATIAGWSSFVVIGGLVAYRCDPQALIRLAPRLTGWTRRGTPSRSGPG